MANLGLFLVVFSFMLVVVIVMSVGVIFKNKPISGSCGGLNGVGVDGECRVCGKTVGENQINAASKCKPGSGRQDFV